MRNFGRLLLVAWIIGTCATQSRAALLETEIDAGAIQVGESVTIRVKLSGGASDAQPVQLPTVPGLRIDYSGMQRSFQFINGKSWSGVELIFTVTALKTGNYKIPGFTFKRGNETLRSREVALVVSAGRPSQGNYAYDLRPAVELSASKVYVGQPALMRYYILSSGPKAELKGFERVPETKGFIVKKIDDAPNETSAAQQPDQAKTLVSTFALIPAQVGSFRVGGGAAVFSLDIPQPRSRGEDFFGFNFPTFDQTKSFEFDTKPITVLPLPRQGAPAGYRGDIGAFVIRTDFTGEPVKVYGEKRITVTVEGKGNLVTMTRPVPEKENDGFKIISEDGESSLKIEGGEITGSRKFLYTIIPEKAGTIEPGSFTFSFFNPKTGAYETLRTSSISFIANADGNKTGDAFDKEAEDRLSFNPLYFLLIVLALAGIIVFVVVWERKRLRIIDAAKTDAQEEKTGDAANSEVDLRAELARCKERGDGDSFLKAADKYLGRISNEDSSPSAVEYENAVTGIKDEIYRYKFGGGKILREDIIRIYDEIMALKKN